MRLYSRLGPVTVTHGDWSGSTGKDDALDGIPQEFGEFLHQRHQDGVPAWEDDAERKARMEAEELARRRDPAQTFDLLDQRLAQVEDAKAVQAKFDAAVKAAVDAALAKERAKDKPVEGVADEPDGAPVKRGPGRPRKSA